MSQKDGMDSVGRQEVIEASNGNLSKLAELARRAYERKDTKDCLDLTRAMLLIDPDNADAQWMRFSIQSDMHRDLDDARAFLRQAQAKESPEKQSQPSQAAVPEGLQLDSAGGDRAPAVLTETVLPAAEPAHSRRTPRTAWLVGAGIVIVLGVTSVSLSRFRAKPNTVRPSLPSPPPAKLGTSDVSTPAVSGAAVQHVFPARPTEIGPASTAPPPAAARSAPPAPRPAAKLPDSPAVMVASGTLAISSPTSVDIYKDDTYLGSVPISLALSAGTHTLEYRHGSLRKSVTHVINSNETTKAMITFDVNVRINSRPWAEVFMEGVERKSLGQTPLGSVNVPIGSVLSFENPQFQTKKYRVTGNETAIQIVFP